MPPSARAARRFARATRYAALSWLTFIAAAAVCIVLAPRPLLSHIGFSFYGVDPVTIVPYLAGMLVSDYFLVKTAHALPRGPKNVRVLSEALIVLGFVVVGVCLTPYTVGPLFRDAHRVVSGVLFFTELGVAFWIVFFLCRRSLALRSLLALQLAAAALTMASELGWANRLFGGELIAQFAFGALVLWGLRQLARPA